MIASSGCCSRGGFVIALLGLRTETVTCCCLERLAAGAKGGVCD